MDRTVLLEWCIAHGIDLSEPQLSAFEEFEEALYAANQSMNLTRVPREECVLRHFIDSLLVAEFLPAGGEVLDIGTGPGFPAWPLACARPDLKVTALDSSGKMLGFLKGRPLPNLEVVQARAEEWGVRERYDAVTGRAVAPLSIQLELSAPPCREGGLVVPMRTPNDALEVPALSKLGLTLEGVERRALPGADIVRVFPRYRKTKKTSPMYPRTWAEIRRKPL